jgi:quaternary ammonium compound-resistance protein SugE
MRPGTAWLILIAAGLFETVWAVGLKYTEGFTRGGPVVLVLAAMAVSVYGLSLAMRVLPVGTAYAVWTGIGTVGAVVIGMAFLGEPRTAVRLACIVLIVSGIVGLRVFS